MEKDDEPIVLILSDFSFEEVSIVVNTFAFLFVRSGATSADNFFAYPTYVCPMYLTVSSLSAHIVSWRTCF